MIRINTMNFDGHLDKLLQTLKGKTIKYATAIKLDPTSKYRWAKNDWNEISAIRIWFTDDSILEITQVCEPVDDEEPHPENPLNIELVEHK